MEQHQVLIDHLDRSLQGEGSPATEQLIGNDPEAAREWNYLLLAVDAIQEAGLQEQVETVKNEWKTMSQTAAVKPAGGIIRQISRNSAKIAAILVVTGAGAAF